MDIQKRGVSGYVNGVKLLIDPVRKTTNFTGILNFDEAIEYVMENELYESINSTIMRLENLPYRNLMFMDEYKLVYDYDKKQVVRLPDNNILETYYKIVNYANKAIG